MPLWGCQAAVAGRPVVTVARWRVGSSSHSLALSGCRVLRQGKIPRPSFVYDIAVGEHFLHGRRVSDEQIQAWADEAEAGYDLQRLLRPTPGAPQPGKGPARL